MSKITTATRCFGRAPGRVSKFVNAADLIGSRYVAVNTEKDQGDLLSYLDRTHPGVSINNATGDNLTAPLNMAFWKAVENGSDYILFASDGFPPTQEQVDELLAQMDANTLVAGARFGQHNFEPGEHVIDGLNTPWNTFALWNVDLLQKWAGGFPVSGTYPQDPSNGGVEEIDAIVTAQANAQAAGITLSAKIVDVASFDDGWDMSGWDAGQIAAHQKKMGSKVSRPKARDLPAGTVTHIAT